MSTATKAQLDFKNDIDSAPNRVIPSDQIIPYYYVSENRIVIAPRFQGFKKRHTVSNISKLNLKKPKLTGTISTATKRKVTNQLTTWLNSIIEFNKCPANRANRREYYPVFITLTLSAKQMHSDNQIKRHMLGEMIKNLKRNYGVKYYFWRAESQKNGNIHFHLIIDKYIDYNSLRHAWNKIQNNNGYIEIFKSKFNHINPNSTDVKSARNVKNFVQYVLKYMTKEESERKIKGRIWGMSDELRDLKQFCDVVDDEINSAIAEIDDRGELDIFISDHFTVINFGKNFKQSRLYMILSKRMRKYYLQIYDDIYTRATLSGGKVDFVPISIAKHFRQAEIHFPRS